MSKIKEEPHVRKGRRKAAPVPLAASSAVMPLSQQVLIQEGDLSSLEQKYSALLDLYNQKTRECELLDARIASADSRLQLKLKETEVFQMLLAAFNVSINDDDSLELLMPKQGDEYFYIRASGINNRFVVCDAVWHGGISDLFRYCKLNVMMDKAHCNRICILLNQRLDAYLSMNNLSHHVKIKI